MADDRTQAPMAKNVVLWAIAAEPLFLAAIAYALVRFGAPHHIESRSAGDTLLVIFAAGALAGMWASFQFASDRFAPKSETLTADRLHVPFGHQIVAVALAAMPGVLGFVHFLLCGIGWVLLLFNLGAFALAARHIVSFVGELD